MTEQDMHLAVIEFLCRQGLLAPGEDAPLTPLTGGVSSDLWRVDLPSGPICVKGALPQLKVAHPWFAPVSRNRVEYRWLRQAQPLAPAPIPRVLAHDEQARLFAMEYLPASDYPVWKTLLLAGQVDVSAAREVGALVGTLHAASAADPAAAATFATDENLDALRIGPYLRVTARAHPDLEHRFAELATRTARTHRSADVAAMTAVNRRFHFTVFDAAAMPRMADMIRVLWDGTDRYRSLYFATAAHRNRVRTEHAAIMSAVASGDADAAVELSRQHREHALEALCDALPAETDELPGATAKTTRRASQR